MMMLVLVIIAVVCPVLSAGEDKVNMMDPNGEDYCPMPRDPRGVMSWGFKEQTCKIYTGWCKNMETHPFNPTSSQGRWWEVLGVNQFYQHMEKRRGRRPRPRGKRQTRQTRSERRDYRLLSDEDRRRFHRALQRLKDSYMDGTRTYDIYVGFHQASMAPGAHFGPAFMPWHREFMLRFENGLREVDPGVSLPYWDSNLDSVLGNSSVDSVMWTADFMGNVDGLVTEGPFANWPIPYESNGNTRLYRDLYNTARNGRAPELFHDRALASILEAEDYRSIVWNVDSAYESFHGATHNYIGGVMTDLANSPSDPMFFLHHAFLDCLFERMRQRQKANGLDIRYYYPNDTTAVGVGRRQPDGSTLQRVEDSLQYSLATMEPFGPLRNIDGLSEDYTDMYYTCAPSATCSRSNLNCGSENLFCEGNLYKCAPRLKVGSECSRFYTSRDEEANPCYRSSCCDGVCSTECENSVNTEPERQPERQPGREPERQPEREPERQPEREPERQPGRPPAPAENVLPAAEERAPVESAPVTAQPQIPTPGPVTARPPYTIPPIPTHGPFPTHPPVPTHPPSHFLGFIRDVVTPAPPATASRREMDELREQTIDAMQSRTDSEIPQFRFRASAPPAREQRPPTREERPPARQERPSTREERPSARQERPSTRPTFRPSIAPAREEIRPTRLPSRPTLEPENIRTAPPAARQQPPPTRRPPPPLPERRRPEPASRIRFRERFNRRPRFDPRSPEFFFRREERQFPFNRFAPDFQFGRQRFNFEPSERRRRASFRGRA